MDLIANLSIGFAAAVSLENVMYCFIGAVIGTLIGVLPGIGPTATIALLLPVTFALSPLSAMIMLAGIYYGSQYGGSTTAILINLPGEAASIVTTVDGHQMAKNGRAGPALAAAAIGSFIAGTIATLLIAMFAPTLALVALEFGAPQYFALMVLGLVCAIVLARGSVFEGFGLALVGILLGLIGMDLYTGAARFTMGVTGLFDGLDFVAMAVGLFGLTEIFRNLESDEQRTEIVGKITNLWPTRSDLKRIIGPSLRGTFLGVPLGILPGGGAMLASFAAYTLEKKFSRNSKEFGKGAIEGVAAPESANNAAAQTSFIPMLTLGIPSNAVMAVMIGALIIQGIVPGPHIARDQPDLFWGLIVSMWLGNVMLLVLNLPLIGIWVRLLQVPYYALFPAIVVFSAIGVYSVNSSAIDLYQVVAFGLLGYVLHKLRCDPVPLILGFILGPMLEENFRRSMILSRGDLHIFVADPICIVLLGITVVALAIVTLPTIGRKRKEVFVDE